MQTVRTLVVILGAAGVVGCGGAAKEAMSPESGPVPVTAEAPPPPPPAEVSGGEALRFADVTVASTSSSGSSSRGNVAGRRAAPQAAKPAPSPAPQKTPQAPATPPPTASAAEAVQKQAPIIIYSAELRMGVFEVDNGLTRIAALARELGGFLAKREDRSIIIRVPAERFDEAVHAIEKLGDVNHRNIVAEDVTEEFHDVDIRLKAAKAVQERLTQLLARAKNVEESIAVSRELDRVTVEIDRLEGRLKFLRNRAAFSTITVIFDAKAREDVSRTPFKMPTPWGDQLGLSRLFRL